MPSRYDASTKAKAVRLVREHRPDFSVRVRGDHLGCGPPGMGPEALRLWIRQDEIDSGEAPGVTTKEFEKTIEFLQAVACFSRGSATRGSVDLPVHGGP
jgi:transposase